MQVIGMLSWCQRYSCCCCCCWWWWWWWRGWRCWGWRCLGTSRRWSSSTWRWCTCCVSPVHDRPTGARYAGSFAHEQTRYCLYRCDS